MFVKICGTTSEEDALLAVAMGADAVGFIFAPSPRQVAPDLVRDIVRRGQAAGELRGGLDPDDTAAVLVAAFDGLKALTDVLDPGDAAAAGFVRRAGTLLLLVEHALLPDPR